MESYYNSHLSYTKGNTHSVLKNITIGKELENAAKKYKDNLALVSCHQNKQFTYEEFDHEVFRVARGLVGLGLSMQETIGIYAPNSFEWVLTQFASSRAGVILVNINPGYQVKDLEYTLNKTKITTLIMPKKLKSSNYVEILNAIDGGFKKRNNHQKHHLNLEKLPYLKRVILLDDVSSAEEVNKDHEMIGKDLTYILK
jgi:fatty-acyl-CoA synthase